MRTLITLLLCVAVGARAAPGNSPPPGSTTAPGQGTHAGPATPATGAGTSLRDRLDRETIRAAIADLPAPAADPYPRRHEIDTISATTLQTFAKEFAAARLPDCLHSEGLKNQPTFFLSGFLALPFIAVAKARGVCR